MHVLVTQEWICNLMYLIVSCSLKNLKYIGYRKQCCQRNATQKWPYSTWYVYCSGTFWKEKELIIWIYKNRKFIEYFQLKSSCHISNALLFIERSIIVSTVLIFVLETHTREPWKIWDHPSRTSGKYSNCCFHNI